MYKVCSTWYGKKKLVKEEDLEKRHSSYALVIKDSKILINKMRASGKYWFPGGAVEEGENENDAVIRETLEETGIEVEVTEKIADVESYFYYDPAGIAWHQLSSFILCDFISEDKKFENPDKEDESAEVVWIDMDQIEGEQMQDYGFEIIELLKQRS